MSLLLTLVLLRDSPEPNTRKMRSTYIHVAKLSLWNLSIVFYIVHNFLCNNCLTFQDVVFDSLLISIFNSHLLDLFFLMCIISMVRMPHDDWQMTWSLAKHNSRKQQVDFENQLIVVLKMFENSDGPSIKICKKILDEM